MGSNPSVVAVNPAEEKNMSGQSSTPPLNEAFSTQALPDTTSIAVNASTQALADFLNVVGNGIADLNTIAVGLAAIGDDHSKPEGLNISWAPKDPLAAARKARKSAVHAAMVVTVEALNQYVRAVTKLPRFGDLIADWSARKPAPSAAEKFSELATVLFSSLERSNSSRYETRFRTCCVMLLIHWRNRHVHTDSNADLTHQDKALLHANAQRISGEYAGLNVDQLLGDFVVNRPTLKEATTLIAMTIQEVRALDAAVYTCRELADLNAWLDHYKLNDRIEKIRRETKPSKQHASVLQMLRTHAPQLREWYESIVPGSNESTPI